MTQVIFVLLLDLNIIFALSTTLSKPVEFLEDQWTSGLMLEYIALRDIQPGEEVRILTQLLANWYPVPSDPPTYLL